MFCTNRDEAHNLAAYLQDPAFDLYKLLKGQWAKGVWRDERWTPPPPRPRLPGIHASEVSTCLRKAAYSLAGVQGTHKAPPSMTQRLAIGQLAHELVQGTLRTLSGTRSSQGAWLHFMEEVQVDATRTAQELKISSSCDGIFTFSSEEQSLFRFGIEIKSESSATWKKRKDPDPKHVQQAMLYMACLDLPAMYFIYVDKESGEPTPFNAAFVLPFDQGMWDGCVEGRILPVLEAAQPQDMPQETGFHCDFCSYKKICDPQARPLPTIRIPGKKP